MAVFRRYMTRRATRPSRVDRSLYIYRACGDRTHPHQVPGARASRQDTRPTPHRARRRRRRRSFFSPAARRAMTTRDRSDRGLLLSAGTRDDDARSRRRRCFRFRRDIYIYHAAHNAITQRSLSSGPGASGSPLLPRSAARTLAARAPELLPLCALPCVIVCCAAAPAGHPRLSARARAPRVFFLGVSSSSSRWVCCWVGACCRRLRLALRAMRSARSAREAAAEPKWNHEPRRRPSSQGNVPNYCHTIHIALHCVTLHYIA